MLSLLERVLKYKNAAATFGLKNKSLTDVASVQRRIFWEPVNALRRVASASSLTQNSASGWLEPIK